MSGRLGALIQQEGICRAADGHTPFLLNDPNTLWWVEAGQLEVFSVEVSNGELHGARSHFFSVPAGAVVFGMPVPTRGLTRAFLAVGQAGTRLRQYSVERFREVACQEEWRAEAVDLLDAWVSALSAGVSRDINPRTEQLLSPGQRLLLSAGQRARSHKGVVWVGPLTDGSVLYLDMEEVRCVDPAAVLPLTQDTRVTALRDCELSAYPTSAVLAQESGWAGLDLLYRLVSDCEVINRQVAAADELNRIRDRQAWDQETTERTFRELRTVTVTDASLFSADCRENPLFAVCQAIGRRNGLAIRKPPRTDQTRQGRDPLSEIVNLSRIRIRQVELTGRWWQGDHGDMLGFLSDGNQPVALLQCSPGVYQLHNPADLTVRRVSSDIAQTLMPEAYLFLRPLQEGPLRAVDLLWFGLKGNRRDLRVMVAVAAAAGLMSAIPPLVTRFLFDSVIPSASSGQVLTVSLSLTGAAVVFLLLQLCRNFAKLRIETRWDLQVQTGLMDRLLNLPVQFFRDYSAGDLAMRVTALGNARVALSGVLALFLLSGFAGIFNAAVMFLYDFRLALTGLAIIVLALIVCLAFTYVAIHHGRIIALLEGQLGSRVLQLLTGIPKLRAAGAEVHAFAAWAGRFSEIRRTKYRLLRHTAWFQTISRSCALFGQMVVFAVTGLLLWRAAAFGGGGEATPISVGTFLAFTTAFFGVVGIVLSVAAFSPQLAAVAPILERLKPILDTPPEVNAHRRDPRNLSGSIEVSHLSYRYRPNCPLVLKDVSFSIRPGEFVAVVGPSGSGKSTLLRLLLGFDQPETGAVHYDGQDLSGLDIGAVRRQIGTVMQNGELLPASILENIRGNRRLSLEECWEALTLAGLKDEVNQLPMGIHTIVGVGARVFSGGQLQRMQIARAIAARPRLVFLDEATTALDNRTQAQVSRSLEQLQSSRLVIAHRLSTVYNADRIIVLHDGCKVQEGTFQELLQVPGVFADLASRQMLKASP